MVIRAAKLAAAAMMPEGLPSAQLLTVGQPRKKKGVGGWRRSPSSNLESEAEVRGLLVLGGLPCSKE